MSDRGEQGTESVRPRTGRGARWGLPGGGHICTDEVKTPRAERGRAGAADGQRGHRTEREEGQPGDGLSAADGCGAADRAAIEFISPLPPGTDGR